MNNKVLCNWCGFCSPAKGKKYCAECLKDCEVECSACHRPFPSRAKFNKSNITCDACVHKVTRQNEKRKREKHRTQCVNCFQTLSEEKGQKRSIPRLCNSCKVFVRKLRKKLRCKQSCDTTSPPWVGKNLNT